MYFAAKNLPAKVGEIIHEKSARLFFLGSDDPTFFCDPVKRLRSTERVLPVGEVTV